MCLFQNVSYSGFADFLIFILSQITVSPALIRFLKSLISFKVILNIALLTFLFCDSIGMHLQITVMKLDHFLDFSVRIMA